MMEMIRGWPSAGRAGFLSLRLAFCSRSLVESSRTSDHAFRVSTYSTLSTWPQSPKSRVWSPLHPITGCESFQACWRAGCCGWLVSCTFKRLLLRNLFILQKMVHREENKEATWRKVLSLGSKFHSLAKKFDKYRTALWNGSRLRCSSF